MASETAAASTDAARATSCLPRVVSLGRRARDGSEGLPLGVRWEPAPEAARLTRLQTPVDRLENGNRGTEGLQASLVAAGALRAAWIHDHMPQFPGHARTASVNLILDVEARAQSDAHVHE